jgi:hypothetical protein
MSLLFADLSGIPIVRAMLVIPFSGIWHADVTLDRAVGPAPVGPQVLTLAGSPYACSPIRAIDFSGERQLRLVGGTGGWRSTVQAREYASPVGVPTALVLSETAGQVGELPPVIAPNVAPTLGPYFCRQADRAALVLQQVLGDGWWMDATGTVQTIPRPTTPIATPFDAIAVDGTCGRYEIASEFPGSWLPGAAFIGPTVSGTVSRVVHVLQNGSLRTEVLVQ